MNSDLGFSNTDRVENNRRVSHIAKILYDTGVILLFQLYLLTNHLEILHDHFPDGDFVEVFVKTSLEECINRDVKNLYNSKKKNKNITGVHSNYDIPHSPELILDTEIMSLKEETQALLKFIF